MDIDAEAQKIRELFEFNKITRKEASQMLDRLDTLAVCEALKEATYKAPPIVS
jgi:hypothetical protein|tara:strand:- start:441 stop:599 length:159 start_codon:yes stop_codon:yes gene_type:complete